MSQKAISQDVKSKEEGNTIQASFQQKSAGISLFIIGTAALYYMARAWPMHSQASASTPIPTGFGTLVVTTVVLIILAQIVLQIVLVIGSGSASELTSRDKEGSLKARRNSYFVFAAGVLAIVALLFGGFPAFYLSNVAMVTLLLAEIIRFASQLFYGRHAA